MIKKPRVMSISGQASPLQTRYSKTTGEYGVFQISRYLDIPIKVMQNVLVKSNPRLTWVKRHSRRRRRRPIHQQIGLMFKKATNEMLR